MDFEKEVLTALGRIDEKLKVLPDHENRLRFLEKLAYSLTGAWTFVTGWLSIHIFGGKS